MKAPVNTKTRKPENAKTGGINLWTRKRRKRENGENKKTAKTGKTRKRENGENPKTRKRRKRRKRRKPENGQKCSCFLVFDFSFSGFLGFLVFSFSGFLVPLAASFWPGRVFYVLSHLVLQFFSTKESHVLQVLFVSGECLKPRRGHVPQFQSAWWMVVYLEPLKNPILNWMFGATIILQIKILESSN